jgi:6-pyruvoyltetrahydropterin/6-carboxytetrahydropterin synthase
MEIKTKLTVDAAHRLTFHEGACKNLHGHTWSVEILIFKERFKDIVVDFGIIKSAIKELMDHKVLVYEQDDVLMTLTAHMERQVFPFETTAENLSLFLKGFIFKQFIEQEVKDDSEKVGIQVTVSETEDNSATV